MACSADRRPAWPYQDQRACAWRGAVPVTACHVSGARTEEKEDPASLQDFLCLWFSSFLPSIIPALPWPIKGKAGHPTKGIDSPQHISHYIMTEPLVSNLEHIVEQKPSSQHPFDLSIRDLGPIPLSPICNPYYELFSYNNMSSSHELDVGTFCLNQYKPCVFFSTPSGPDAQ